MNTKETLTITLLFIIMKQSEELTQGDIAQEQTLIDGSVSGQLSDQTMKALECNA